MVGKALKYPRLTHHLIQRERKGSHLLIHPSKPRWIIINKLAYEILMLCDGKTNIDGIALNIANRSGKNKEEILSEVKEFLDNISSKSWLFSRPEEDNLLNLDLTLKRVQFNITEICNQFCIHCAAISERKREEELLKEEIFNLIDKFADLKVETLIFSGGEPFLREDILETLEYASNHIHNIIIGTNATLITPEISKRLSKIPVSIQISIDGSNPSIHDQIRGKGSFLKTMKGLELLMSEGFKDFIISTTVMGKNAMDISSILLLAREKGIKFVRFLPLQKIGRANKNWTDLSLSQSEQEQFYRKLYGGIIPSFPDIQISCGISGFTFQDNNEGMSCQVRSFLAIASNGDVYPCPLLSEEQFCLGNVRNIEIKKLVYSAKREKLQKTYLERAKRLDECCSCDWRGFCKGACPASVYLEKGTYMEVDDLCKIRNELYETLLFSLKERKLNTANDICG
jgi:radical SAM protein with 4Fe4S-binding SPASM domain